MYEIKTGGEQASRRENMIYDHDIGRMADIVESLMVDGENPDPKFRRAEIALKWSFPSRMEALNGRLNSAGDSIIRSGGLQIGEEEWLLAHLRAFMGFFDDTDHYSEEGYTSLLKEVQTRDGNLGKVTSSGLKETIVRAGLEYLDNPNTPVREARPTLLFLREQKMIGPLSLAIRQNQLKRREQKSR